MIEPPFTAKRGMSGIWIEDGRGVTIFDLNPLLLGEPDAFEVAELLTAGANQLYARENPSAPWTVALKKQIESEGANE